MIRALPIDDPPLGVTVGARSSTPTGQSRPTRVRGGGCAGKAAPAEEATAEEARARGIISKSPNEEAPKETPVSDGDASEAPPREPEECVSSSTSSADTWHPRDGTHTGSGKV